MLRNSVSRDAVRKVVSKAQHGDGENQACCDTSVGVLVGKKICPPKGWIEHLEAAK